MTTQTMGVETTLADLVRGQPSLAEALDGLELDFCCNGSRTLAEACKMAGIDLDVAVARLEEAMAEHATTEGRDADELHRAWVGLDLARLADHIEAVHHVYLHRELPELEHLAAKVESAHGRLHPELADVRRLVVELARDLPPHLKREERILFPAIRALAAGRAGLFSGSVIGPVTAMSLEHERTGAVLARLRSLTASYEAPEDTCPSTTDLYRRLAHLEADTHLHVLKESSGLFPGAITLEERSRAPRPAEDTRTGRAGRPPLKPLAPSRDGGFPAGRS